MQDYLMCLNLCILSYVLTLFPIPIQIVSYSRVIHFHLSVLLQFNALGSVAWIRRPLFSSAL